MGANDDDTYTLRVIQRIARRSGERVRTDAPGILYLEIDGLARPVLQRAMRDGNAPTMARWLMESTHRFLEWEPDLSSQTGASQAGILLGSNEDIPAFRWVEKERGIMMTCSAPPDCEEIERRHAGNGLLTDGGSSRGNLLSGEADHVILTVSRIDAEKGRNPGYRAFFANGHNVTRALVLFFWEVILEWTAALRAIRRDVQPRGHRGGIYPFLRGAMCVIVRDLIVFGVLTDVMKGRPAIYATFSSYDEVAHHSGLERADTLEALRKLDQQFARIDLRAGTRRDPTRSSSSPITARRRGRPSSSATATGSTTWSGARSSHATSPASPAATSRRDGRPRAERGNRAPREEAPKNDVSGQDVIVLGSGNLGLIYLMEEPRRLTMEEIDERHPRLLAALREHPHVGWLLVCSAEHGAVVFGAGGTRYLLGQPGGGHRSARAVLADGAPASPSHGRVRARGRHHGRELLRPRARRRLRVRGADLLPRGPRGLADPSVHPLPRHLPMPEEPLIGAAAVHDLLKRWRTILNNRTAEPTTASVARD